MVALGEMATYIPISGAFTVYAARFVDPSLGFAMGWMYWFSWAITFALELTASGLIIQYWAPDLNIGIFIGVFFVVITALNYLPVSFYGEVEFWFALIKVVTVLGFLIFAICIDAGAGQNGYLGFETWRNPGAFAPYLVEDNAALAKFVGFWAVLIQAGFSYQGTELVAIAAGETENPRKTVPAAIKKTFYRILFFFVFTVFFLGLLIPYDNEQLLNDSTDASASPLVIAAKLAGVKVLPGIINAVLLCVVLSAANSNVYCGSRILVGLAESGSAPKWFLRTTKSGVPWIGVTFTAAFGLLGFLNESNNAATVFGWLLNITAIAGFISWTCINIVSNRKGRRPAAVRERLSDDACGSYTAPYLCTRVIANPSTLGTHRIHESIGRPWPVSRHSPIQGLLAAMVQLVWGVFQCADHPHQWFHGLYPMEHIGLLRGVHQRVVIYRALYRAQTCDSVEVHQANRGGPGQWPQGD